MPEPDLAAELEEIQERAVLAARAADDEIVRRFPTATACADSAEDVPRLLTAIGAVLELADDLATERRGEIGPGYNATRACGHRFREAITTALAGEGTDDA